MEDEAQEKIRLKIKPRPGAFREFLIVFRQTMQDRFR